MSITNIEKNILRELAKKYSEFASMEIQKEHINRMKDINDLKPRRPVVLIDEVPWHEMDIEGQLQLHCTDKIARNMECFFRRKLFQWRYFPGDMVLENFYSIYKTVYSTGNGITIQENVAITDASNNIVSHEYIDQLSTEADLKKLHCPTITVDDEVDLRNVEFSKEILGDIMPVKLRGYNVYHSPWDEIAMLRGVSAILYDIVDRPKFVHELIKRFTEINLSIMDQYEKLGLLDYNISNLHCTPPYVSNLPSNDYNGGKIRLKDVWIRSAAQMFSTISPTMHEEFDLQYSKTLFERCGLVYYGCCEPLDNKIEILKKIPNMRKIGISPWANVISCAEQIGGNFVYARKPNPANVASKTDVYTIQREISETIEACLKSGCSYEFVLKDISTVSYRPENLILWENTVRETIDSYYS